MASPPAPAIALTQPIIQVRNLSKVYRLGSIGARSLTEEIAGLWNRWRGRSPLVADGGSGAASRGGQADFWALRDVSFDVQPGEIVGIIGRNGAGKSTLLKILSRITQQSAGEITLRGRVASLLEVGTGFHPDLTGRENIFLNGAILGMTKAEIRGKLDEIIAFAEVEKFIDTPVKRYSSGMYVRLAFAVAAHLEPEILIVDEVLAVGDIQFQKKCLGKMGEVSRGGRTVLFVSHQIAAVTRLCKSALWLDGGRILEFGPAHQVCSHYLANGSQAGTERAWTPQEAPGNEWVRLDRVEALADGEPAGSVGITRPVDLILHYTVLKEGKVLIPNIHLFTDDGTLVFIAHDWHSGWRTTPKPPGRYRTIFRLPGNFFAEGRITVTVAMGTYLPYAAHFTAHEAVAFTMVEEEKGITSRGDYAGILPGVVRPLIAAETELLASEPAARTP